MRGSGIGSNPSPNSFGYSQNSDNSRSSRTTISPSQRTNTASPSPSTNTAENTVSQHPSIPDESLANTNPLLNTIYVKPETNTYMGITKEEFEAVREHAKRVINMRGSGIGSNPSPNSFGYSQNSDNLRSSRTTISPSTIPSQSYRNEFTVTNTMTNTVQQHVPIPEKSLASTTPSNTDAQVLMRLHKSRILKVAGQSSSSNPAFSFTEAMRFRPAPIAPSTQSK